MIDSILIKGPVNDCDGYGYQVINLVKALVASGVRVNLESVWQPRTDQDVPESVLEALASEERNDIGVIICVPTMFKLLTTPIRVGFSMFEWPILPHQWAEYSSAMTANFVPSNWCRSIWIQNGVPKPIYTVPLGFDPEVYQPYDREGRDTFTFVTSGTLQTRKNPLMVYEAFLEAFPTETDVRLIIKTTEHLPLKILNPDKRVTVLQGNWERSKILDLYHQADCFVYPTSAEGFGLPPLEAMATGLPVICSKDTGCSEFIQEGYAYPIPTIGYATCLTYMGTNGLQPMPSYSALRNLMKLVYQDRTSASELGYKAAEWARRKFTWAHSASKFMESLEHLGAINV